MHTFEKRRTTVREHALHRFPSPKFWDPWIFYSHGHRNRAHTFYSLSERRVHNKCLKEMLDTDILCSLHGWLMLSTRDSGQSFRLFNPVSMATIHLPLFTKPCSYDIAALSCDPNNPDCIVMLIRRSLGSAYCYFCRPGDNVWNEKDLELEVYDLNLDYIRAVGCYKDQICILTRFDRIFLFVANPPYLTLINFGVDNYITCCPRNFGWYKSYLVESDGELFVILKYYLRESAYDFAVRKLDISDQKRFVAVDDLGGRAFFLSSSSSGTSCSVVNNGIKRNTIYFTQPSDPCIYSFDMQNKVLTFSLPCPNVKRNLGQAQWILPLSPNTPRITKLDCKVDIIAPPQIKKFTMEQLSISKSVGKDWSRFPDDSINSVAEKLPSKPIDRDWSELPQDVLILIAEKLSGVSCARAAMVNKSWRSVITWAPKNLLDGSVFFRMLSSSNELFHFISNGRYNLLAQENSEVLSVQHAKYGWLLATKHFGDEIFFLNPLTKEKIEIPNLPDNCVRGLCFSTLPTSTNCCLLGIYEDASCYLVYHIRRGEKEWKKIEILENYVGDYELVPYSNPVFHNGIFYWIWGSGNLCAYDPRGGEVKFLVKPQNPCKYAHISYLFESEEKLMSVWIGRHGKGVKFYELDKTSFAWKEVNTIGNKVVFLSRNSSLVINSVEMPDFEDMICFNRFTNDKPLLYSLKTREFAVYGGDPHVIRDFCDIPEYQLKSAWIKPNIKQHHVRELSWYDSV